jgi:hypothetical protein
MKLLKPFSSTPLLANGDYYRVCTNESTTNNSVARRQPSVDTKAGSFFKSKMINIVANMKTTTSFAVETVKTLKKHHPQDDSDDEESEARRSLGYIYAGKVLLRLSFFDLR